MVNEIEIRKVHPRLVVERLGIPLKWYRRVQLFRNMKKREFVVFHGKQKWKVTDGEIHDAIESLCGEGWDVDISGYESYRVPDTAKVYHFTLKREKSL